MNAAITKHLTSEEFQNMLSKHFKEPVAPHYDKDLTKMEPITATDGCDNLKLDKPPVILLTKDGTNIEMGFRVPGFIVEKDLPPIERRVDIRLPKNVKGMRQYVILSGMGHDIFNLAIKNCMAIHDYFRRRVKEGALPDWTPEIYQGFPALSFSCRYLSHQGDGPVIDLGPDVDPKGLLAKASRDLIHTADNSVGYFFRLNQDSEIDKRPYVYGNAPPQILRIGHLVELHVSFCLRPARTKGHWYFSQTLRSITVLDSSIDKALLNERFQGMGGIMRPEYPLAIKRVYGIPLAEDADVIHARKRMMLLNISGRSGNSRVETEDTMEEEEEAGEICDK